MTLSTKEKYIALVANAIAAYSIYTKTNSLPENQTLIDFILKSVPESVKSEITMELIDEVFEYVSSSHMEQS